MATTLSGAQALALLDDDTRKEAAALLIQAIIAGNDVEVQTFDLTTARAKENSWEVGSFKSLAVIAATDASAKVYFRPISKQANQGAIPFSIKDAVSFPLPFVRGYFHWDAQPGKTLTILLLSKGEFRFGSQISVQAGGVSISEGSTVTSRAIAGLSISSTAAILLPADPDRKVETCYNGEGETIWIGGATVTDDVGAAPGIPISAGTSFDWKSTAALYAVKTGAGALTKFFRMVQK